MAGLFVNKTIDINAPVTTVWDVLTKPEYTRKWIREFGVDGEIESDWEIGSEVLWKDKSGKVLVTGNVTALEPYKRLRFTVHDAAEAFDGPQSDNDGITYTCKEHEGVTVLVVMQGDFGVKPEYRQYYHATVRVWDIVLPLIKSLAEGTN